MRGRPRGAPSAYALPFSSQTGPCTPSRLPLHFGKGPFGYLVREVPRADVKQLKLLAGHLKEGQFLTKIRKTFTRDEMTDDLLIVPAKLGEAEDRSEYEEVLPTSPL